MRSLRCAFALLTRFPVSGPVEAADIPKSVGWYFLPALCVGALSALVFLALSALHVAYFAALCFLLTEILLTGALHVDGFADVCDAFLCPATPERRLEIMHDSRLGTFGVLGLAFDIGARLLLIGALSCSVETILWLIAVPVAGKFSLLLVAVFSAPAAATGMGASLIGRIPPKTAVISTVLLVACLMVLCRPVPGLLAAAVSCIAGLAMRHTAKKNIGGANGDVLGAANELGEIGCLLLLSAWRNL